MIISCWIYLLSDTAARKARNLLTNKTCHIGWVELRAYRQWRTGLTKCVKSSVLSNVTTTAWSINLFQTQVVRKRTKFLRLPDVSALSGFKQRIPLSKNESNTCFWSYVSTLDMSLCFGIFRPSSNETEEHAITSLFTAEEKRQPEIRQRGVSMHRRLAISTFLPFAQNLYLRYHVASKTDNPIFLKCILNIIKYNNLDI